MRLGATDFVGGRAVRSPRYKLVEHAAGGREFYDLGQDPLERVNLMGSSMTEAQKARLRYLEQRLAALLATR